ncbi:MAG: (2Fe-2S)-binding protein [Planktomarina sp.]|jgi:carbon-monoxide dehydrogenase small subunit|nr:(2Fe-2S)-binding protein [Planktomarina sp.]
MKLSLRVNGKSYTDEVSDNTLLVEYLRDYLRLTGTHIGCDTSQCGACVVHLEGKAIKSCSMLAASAHGTEITTIEGLAKSSEDLHPMQVAFKENHGLQCGFCTPGMIMVATDMVKRYQIQNKDLTENAIKEELEGNICRCTGYHNIVKSIANGASKMTN